MKKKGRFVDKCLLENLQNCSFLLIHFNQLFQFAHVLYLMIKQKKKKTFEYIRGITISQIYIVRNFLSLRIFTNKLTLYSYNLHPYAYTRSIDPFAQNARE